MTCLYIIFVLLSMIKWSICKVIDKVNHIRMYRLLERLKEVNEYPIVLNTSFNLKDQTMVRDTREALHTFMSCDMDYLVVGNFLVSKKIF